MDQQTDGPNAVARLTAEGWSPLVDLGFAEAAGPYWQRAHQSGIDYGFVAEARHRNRNGQVHGGVLLSFADQAMGMAAWHASGKTLQATAQLNFQFVAGVAIGEFVDARCTVVRTTRSLVFVTAVLSVGNRIVATTSGVWKLIGR